MIESKPKTKLKDKGKKSLAESLNQIPMQTEDISSIERVIDEKKMPSETSHINQQTSDIQNHQSSDEDEEYKEQISAVVTKLFREIEDKEFAPQDFEIDVPVDSLESAVGYSSLIRQMNQAFLKSVAFYRSEKGGNLSIEEARKKAFHRCTNEEEAIKIFDSLMNIPLENLNFASLSELYSYSPRAAEWIWEKTKKEGRKEFIAGDLAAHSTFPAPYMKTMWNIGRFLGVRDSFLDEWNPKGGIEVALIDMLAQSYFQWQYWLEQVVLRSETAPRKEHREYEKWKRENQKTKNTKSWEDGYWFPPYVSEQEALEKAVQMADRFNRIFLRTLRQLRDLRRYSPLTINNPSQVNIAGQQVNLNNSTIDSEI